MPKFAVDGAESAVMHIFLVHFYTVESLMVDTKKNTLKVDNLLPALCPCLWTKLGWGGLCPAYTSRELLRGPHRASDGLKVEYNQFIIPPP